MSSPVALSRPLPDQPCCCGSGVRFDTCCGALHAGTRKAETAEQLMRARFSAHVVQDDLFLHRTYLGTANTPFKEEGPQPSLGWTRLVVHSHEVGPKPDQSFVEFSAFFTDAGAPEQVLQERSEFKLVGGQWFYSRLVRSGPAPVKSSTPKVGRNDPCPCGSGKKYKQCCLKA